MRARLHAWFVPSTEQWGTFWRAALYATLAFFIVREIVAHTVGFPEANAAGGGAFMYACGLVVGRRDCQAQHPEQP